MFQIDGEDTGKRRERRTGVSSEVKLWASIVHWGGGSDCGVETHGCFFFCFNSFCLLISLISCKNTFELSI